MAKLPEMRQVARFIILAEVIGEECRGALVGFRRASFVAPFAEFGGKAVIEPGIVVQRDLGVIVEPLVHRRLRRLVDESVVPRDVEHQRMRDGVLLAQQTVDAHRIVTDRGVDVGACGRHVGEAPAEAVADAADLRDAFAAADPVDRRFDIANALVLVELPHQIERALEFWLDVGIELYPRLEPPEQVGRDGEITVLGQSVALAADAGVHSEDFLDHHDCRARRPLGPGDVRAEAVIARECLDGRGLAHLRMSLSLRYARA